MKRPLLTLLILCLFVSMTNAQIWKVKRWEAVVGFGPSFFFGDIGGFSKTKNLLGLKDFSLLQTRFDVNADLKYRITQTFNVRLSFTTGLLHATDIRGSNEGRDFEAAIQFWEPAVISEYYFVKNKAENSYLFSKGKNTGFIGFLKSLDFYAFAGVGGVNYSIKPNDKLQNYGLNPGGFAAVIPVGIGSTMIYSPNFNFGVEISGRYAFSDNIDGYTSQFSSSNDVYYFFNFTITYKMKNSSKGWPSFR